MHTEPPLLKLCDFGLAKMLQDAGAGADTAACAYDKAGDGGDGGDSEQERGLMAMTSHRGTSTHMAPELLRGEAVADAAKCDSYAFGILMWCLLSGPKHPYGHMGANRNTFNMLLAITENGERPRVDGEWPVTLSNMMQRCWSESATNRPTFEQLYQVADMEMCKLPNSGPSLSDRHLVVGQ